VGLLTGAAFQAASLSLLSWFTFSASRPNAQPHPRFGVGAGGELGDDRPQGADENG
jgi:hypothetical protein